MGGILCSQKEALVHSVVGVHRVFELGDVGVLGDVVNGCGREAEADLAPLLVIHIKEAMPNV